MRTVIHVLLFSAACMAVAVLLAPPALIGDVLPVVSVQDPVIHAPMPIPAGHTVIVTSRIQSGPGAPRVIPGGVYLFRLDSANRFAAVLGVMHDDGANGDATAGDGVFSLRVTAAETLTELRVQVSAPFSGMSKRIATNASCVPIVKNRRPVAKAGPDQSVSVGSTVQLDGSRSSDPDGDRLYFKWSFVSMPAGSQARLSGSTTVRPTFVADRPGTYKVQLVVNDGKLASYPDTVIIQTSNSAPVANAGPDQTTAVGHTVILDGSASSDLNGDPLTFAWSLVSIPAGSGAVLADPHSVHPTFTADLPGTYNARLVVNDGHVDSLPDTVTISTLNTAPVANAGPDQSVAVGQAVTLDGSGSSDIDHDALTFSWSLTSTPADSTASLVNPTSVTPGFVADLAGTYVVQLVVNDGQENSQPDTVVITTQNTTPVADAGPDQTASVGSAVQLNGSASSDVDGDSLTFGWSLVSRPAGSAAELSDATSVQPEFVADAAGTYVAQLIVNDGSLASNPDTVVISTSNTPPVADAGPDQTPLVGTTVVLNGIASSDADGNPLTFSWSFVSRPDGSAAVLIDPSSITPQFPVDLPGTYVVQLIVSDGTVNSAPDSVTISTMNSRPVANAGADQSVPFGGNVTLDGSGSSDADGNNLTFGWSFTSRPAGSTASLSDPTAIGPTFTADVAGLYVVQLIVNDSELSSLPDTATITAFANEMSLTIDGAVVGVGRSLTGRVTLAQPAPPGGVTVFLTSSNSSIVSVAPVSVTIAAGETQASFSVTGVSDGSTEIAATATGFSTATVPIAATSSLISIGSIPTLSPTQTVQFAVSITQPAPAGGLTIHFTSSNPGVATVSPSVTVPEGLRIPASNPQIAGVSLGTTVITAEAVNFVPDTRDAVVGISMSFSPSALTVTSNTTGNITLQLASPAPAGGLTVALAMDNPSVATAPAAATVPGGQNSTEITITGVADGTTTLRANAVGVAEATATIVVNTPSINIGNFSVGNNLQEVVGSVQHATLGRPAPAVTGVDLTITSSDPARLLVSANPNAMGGPSAIVHVNGGETSIPTFALQALANSGTVQITTTATGYATDTSTVTLSPSGFVIPVLGSFTTTAFSPNVSFQVSAARLEPGTLLWAASQPVRGGLFVPVPVTSSDSSVGTITTSPLLFGGNVLQLPTEFDPLNAGSTTIAVETPAGFETPGNRRQITATVTAPAISIAANPRVGEDLQFNFPIALVTAPPSPVDVTATIADGSIARVSDNATVLGGTTATFAGVANTASRALFIQGLLQGTTTLTVSAPGYTTNTQTVTVDPSGFVIFLPGNFTTNTFAANVGLQITAARLSSGTLDFSANQQVRAGLTVQVPFTSSDTNVGVIASNPLTFGPNVGFLTTDFDPLNAGTTTIAIETPPGFDTPNNLRQLTATVTAPVISVPLNPRVGEDLQDNFSVSLGSAPPSPVDITVTVASGAVARVSDNALVLGGTTVTIPAVGNTQPRAFTLQGLAQGTTTLTVSAPGYVTNIQTVTVDPSGFVIAASDPLNTNTFAANAQVTIGAGRLNPGTLAWSGSVQKVRAGLTVDVPVTSSNSTVGAITISPVSFASNASLVSTFFDPLTAGTTTLAAGTPSGFDTPSTSRQATATVTAPAITAPVNPRIGEDLQDDFTIALSTAPPSPVDITLTISAGSVARVSTDAAVLGGTTLTLPAVANTATRTIFLQGLQKGSTTLTVTAAGYATSVQTIAVDPSGFVITGPVAINTTASAANVNVQIAPSRLDPVTLDPQSPFSLGRVLPGMNVQVDVSTSNPSVGVMTLSPLSFDSTVIGVLTQFDPLAAGSTTIVVTPPSGFDTPNSLRQITATVNP